MFFITDKIKKVIACDRTLLLFEMMMLKLFSCIYPYSSAVWKHSNNSLSFRCWHLLSLIPTATHAKPQNYNIGSLLELGRLKIKLFFIYKDTF